MTKKLALGKGLGALIPVYEAEEPEKGFTLCPIDEIDPNPNQPRTRFEEESLNALSETIRKRGVLQPLLVRRKQDRYEIIAGERRWRAARKAGLEKVPVLVRDAEEDETLEISLLENLQREDLNPIEEARAYRRMVEQLNITQEELAGKIGKDRSSVANAIRLLQLPREIQEDVSTGDLSAGHARALLALSHEILQLRVRALIKERGLTVRETEKHVQQLKAGRKEERPKAGALDPDMQKVQDDLCRLYGARVEIKKRRRGGSVRIPFLSLEDLDRICSLLLRQA
ncbi:MAG: ParB/RepB/Spo0J family partition protein [bacterium]